MANNGNNRIERISAEIQRVLSDILRNELHDPRVKTLCSIVKVELTNDMQHCKVFVTVYGTPEEQKQTFTAIESAKGFIRHQLATKIDLRKIPELHFVADDTIAYSVHIGQLIDKINAEKENK